jgi:hypothetical protein
MQLSENFSFEELTTTGHDNMIEQNRVSAQKFMKQLKYTAGALEECRKVLGVGLQITSGYRMPTLNKAVGGSATSKHTQGLCADFKPVGMMTVKEAFDKLLKDKDKLFSVRKVIIEGGGKNGATWIHMQAKVAKDEPLEFFASNDGGKTFKGVA